MQKGFAQIFITFILAVGLLATLYLVSKQIFFKPKASLTGTRVEIFGPTVSGNKTTSKNVKLKIVYEFPNHGDSAMAFFTRQGDFKEKNIPEGFYTIYFHGSSNDPAVVVPSPIDVEIKRRNITEIIIATDGKAIGCPENAVRIGTIHCLKYKLDLLLPSAQLKLETMPSATFYTTVTPKGTTGVNQTQEPAYPTTFKVVNVKPEIVADIEFVEAKKALFNYGKEYQFSQNNQEIDWDIAEGYEGNGLKKVYVRFDNRSDPASIVWTEIVLEEPTN